MWGETFQRGFLYLWRALHYLSLGIFVGQCTLQPLSWTRGIINDTPDGTDQWFGRRAELWDVGSRTSGFGLCNFACRTVQKPTYGRIAELKLRKCLKQKESVYGEVICKYGARKQNIN
jgi:hypothetical protein